MVFFYERRTARGKDQSKLCCVCEHVRLLLTLLGLGVLVEVKACWMDQEAVAQVDLYSVYIVLLFLFPFKTCNLCMCLVKSRCCASTTCLDPGSSPHWPHKLGLGSHSPKLSSIDIFYFLNIDHTLLVAMHMHVC